MRTPQQLQIGAFAVVALVLGGMGFLSGSPGARSPRPLLLERHKRMVATVHMSPSAGWVEGYAMRPGAWLRLSSDDTAGSSESAYSITARAESGQEIVATRTLANRKPGHCPAITGRPAT